MKLRITNFIFLIILGFSINLLTPTDSKAGAWSCNKDADGAIIINDTAEKFFTLANGEADDQCSEQPDFYKVLIYKIGLCKEDPYTAGGGSLPDYTSCIILDEDFTRVISDSTIIQPDAETSLKIPEFRIPIGTYPYATLIVNSKISVKHIQTYSYLTGIPSNKGVRGFEATDFLNDGVTNTVCWTLDRYTSMMNDAYAVGSSFAVAHGLDAAVIKPVADRVTSTLQCGTAVGTAEYATEIIEDLGDEAFANFRNYEDSFEDTGITGIKIAAQLLKDQSTISDGVDNSRLIAVHYEYTNPVRITEQTVGLNINIKTSSAVSIDFCYDNDNKVFWACKVGANAFTAKILTKERRRGRARAWR